MYVIILWYVWQLSERYTPTYVDNLYPSHPARRDDRVRIPSIPSIKTNDTSGSVEIGMCA